MYGKIFESMYDGTLSADWKAMVVFQQCIVLANSEGVVDYTPPALSRRTGIPLAVIEHGITKLQEPDKYSRSPDEDGRRLVLIDSHRDWGWYIVNFEKYRDFVRREDKLRADRERIAEKRKSLTDKACRKVSQNVASVADVAHEEEAKEEAKDAAKKRSTAPAVPSEFEEFKNIYPKRAGSNPWKKAERAINARLKEGATWEDILAGVNRYAEYCQATDRIGTEFVKQAVTFCGPEQEYLLPWDLPRQPKSKNPDDHRHQELR